MLQIIYYRNKCIGCAGCAEVAPQRWRMSKKDGKSTLVGGISKKSVFQTRVGLAELEMNQKAAANCPVNIIHLKEL